LTGGPAGWNCNFAEKDGWDFFIVDYQRRLTSQKKLAAFPKKVVFGNVDFCSDTLWVILALALSLHISELEPCWFDAMRFGW